METLSPEVAVADVEGVRTIGRKGTGRGRVEVLARERRRTWTPEQKRAIVAESLSSSGYYAWVKRRPSRRAETDAALLAEIHAAHATSCGTYGVPRIHAELTAKGICVGRKRVARLMSRAGIAGVSRRRFVVTTVKGDGSQAPDLVERQPTSGGGS